MNEKPYNIDGLVQEAYQATPESVKRALEGETKKKGYKARIAIPVLAAFLYGASTLPATAANKGYEPKKDNKTLQYIVLQSLGGMKQYLYGLLGLASGPPGHEDKTEPWQPPGHEDKDKKPKKLKKSKKNQVPDPPF